MAGKLVVCFMTGILTFAVTFFWRDFPLRLAVLMGALVGALVYSSFQASARLGRMYRRK